MSDKRRVVITGLGWATSLGTELEAVWSALLAGQSGIRPIERWDASNHAVRIAGIIEGWDGGKHFEMRDLKRVDRFAQFAMSAAADAVEDSGLDFSREDSDRMGVIIGSGIGGIEEFEAGHAKMLEKGPSRVSPFMIPKLMINAASANVSIHFGITGVNSAAVTACASASNAMCDAVRTIQMGEAEVIVSGGAEAAVTPLGVACFSTMRALSTRNDDPEKASRPFDRDRDGFVIAEGAGVLVLEEYEHAKKRNARIYGEVKGFGISADAGHLTAPDEQGKGAARAMELACKSADIPLEKISYINGHATSTPLGDLAENNAIKNLFGDHAYKLAVSSTKSMTGHLLGASGGIEAISTIKSLTTGDIPPTINLDNPDEGCDLNYTAHTADNREMDHVMTNNFGFGGHNVSLIFGRV